MEIEKSFIFFLSIQLFLLVKVIDRQKRNYNGGFVGIVVILFVITVATHLSLFKSLRSVKHNENDADIRDNGSDPLTERQI